jgi:membrane protein YdbS with pleckstrin-like domain
MEKNPLIYLSAFIGVIILIVGNYFLSKWGINLTKKIANKRLWLFYFKYTIGPILIIIIPLLLLALFFEEFRIVFTEYFLMLWLLVIIFFLLLISILLTRIYNNKYSYTLEKDFIYIERGLFSEKKINIPYSKIGKVQVSDDFFHRLFGLNTVDIIDSQESEWKKINNFFDLDGWHNTNEEHYYKYGNRIFHTIDGLDKEKATELKNAIEKKISY